MQSSFYASYIKHLGRQKPLYFTVAVLQKAFDPVPRKVLWWALRRARVEERVILPVKAMHKKANFCVRLNG